MIYCNNKYLYILQRLEFNSNNKYLYILQRLEFNINFSVTAGLKFNDFSVDEGLKGNSSFLQVTKDKRCDSLKWLEYN